MLRPVLLSAVFSGALSGAFAESLIDKAARDQTVSIKAGDPAMTAAMKKARAGLPAFLALADAPPPDTSDFSVKVGLPLGNGMHEYIWIRPFTHSGDAFVGRVVNTPRDVSNLVYGDRLAFNSTDIVDWSYSTGGRRKGHYTTCVLIHDEPTREREIVRKHLGIDCGE